MLLPAARQISGSVAQKRLFALPMHVLAALLGQGSSFLPAQVGHNSTAESGGSVSRLRPSGRDQGTAAGALRVSAVAVACTDSYCKVQKNSGHTFSFARATYCFAPVNCQASGTERRLGVQQCRTWDLRCAYMPLTAISKCRSPSWVHTAYLCRASSSVVWRACTELHGIRCNFSGAWMPSVSSLAQKGFWGSTRRLCGM